MLVHYKYLLQKTFQINLEDGSPDDIRATLNGPDSSPPVRLNWIGKVAHCSFVPVETGQHKVRSFITLYIECYGVLIFFLKEKFAE